MFRRARLGAKYLRGSGNLRVCQAKDLQYSTRYPNAGVYQAWRFGSLFRDHRSVRQHIRKPHRPASFQDYPRPAHHDWRILAAQSFVLDTTTMITSLKSTLLVSRPTTFRGRSLPPRSNVSHAKESTSSESPSQDAEVSHRSTKSSVHLPTHITAHVSLLSSPLTLVSAPPRTPLPSHSPPYPTTRRGPSYLKPARGGARRAKRRCCRSKHTRRRSRSPGSP